MITGQESALATALTSAIKAAIQTQIGTPVQQPEYIEPLCIGIANALIPFLVTNTEVNAGQLVQVTPISGTGATSGPGTIS